MQENNKGGKREGAGRPIGTLRPSGKKARSFRLTDEEYELVKDFIKKLHTKYYSKRSVLLSIGLLLYKENQIIIFLL